MNSNKVFLADLEFFRPENIIIIKPKKEQYYRTNPTKEIHFDGFQYIIEELISFAVSEIFIKKSEINTMQFESMPKFYKKIIKTINYNYFEKLIQKILKPIVEDMDAEFDQYGILRSKNHNKKDSVLINSLDFNLFINDLTKFLIGVEYKVQIEINLYRTKMILNQLKNVFCKSPNVRSILSILLGIFNSYKACSFSTIKYKSTINEDFLLIFEEFLNDSTYNEMSMNAHLWGIPETLKKSINSFKILSKQMLRKPTFKQFLNYGNRVISASTKIPVPDSELAESILKHKYLPTIIDFVHEAKIRALRNWLNKEGLSPSEIGIKYESLYDL